MTTRPGPAPVTLQQGRSRPHSQSSTNGRVAADSGRGKESADETLAISVTPTNTSTQPWAKPPHLAAKRQSDGPTFLCVMFGEASVPDEVSVSVPVPIRLRLDEELPADSRCHEFAFITRILLFPASRTSRIVSKIGRVKPPCGRAVLKRETRSASEGSQFQTLLQV